MKKKKRTMRRKRNTSPNYMKNDKTIDEAVKEFLDNEIESIKEKIDPKVGARFSDVNIRIVSWDIKPIHRNLYLVAIAKMDDKHYGAFYSPNRPPFPPDGYAEEIRVTPGTLTMVGEPRLIHDIEEWQFVTAFFNTHNVFESQRIFNWALQVKQGQDMREVVKKLPWFEKVSKDRGITAEEVASAIIRRDPTIQK